MAADRKDLDRALASELDRRLAELGRSDDAAFGSIGWTDAVLVAIFFLLLPLLAIWIAA